MSVRVICGAPGQRRDAQIDTLIHETWGRSLLVVPTQQMALRRTETLVLEQNSPGIWGEPVMTFGGFVRHLLSAERDPALRPFTLSDIERRLVLQQAVATCKKQGQLGAAGDAVATEGFINHLQRVIESLKQAAVDPGVFRERLTKRRSQSPYDSMVASVYAAYQDIMRGKGVFDEIGLYWIADLLCRSQAPRALQGVDRICFDGFDDFTPSEFRLLGSLATRVPELIFAIHMDKLPERSDLFAVQQHTLEQLGNDLSATITWLEMEPPQTYTQHAASYLLWRGEPPPSNIQELVPDLTVQACAGVMVEIETIGRAVKQLLLENVPAEQIAVVFRDIDSMGPSIEATFREFGIPVTMSQVQPLTASATGSSVMAFFDAIAEWDRDAVSGLLTTPFFQPKELRETHLLDAVPTVARLAEIIRGRADWLRSIDWLKEQLKRSSTEEADYHLVRQLQRIPDIGSALDAMKAAVEHLGAIADSIPDRGSWVNMVQSVDTLLRACQFETIIESLPEVQRPTEQAAIKVLRRLLTTLHAFHPKEKAIPKSQFVSELRHLLQLARFPIPTQRDGVVCLDAGRIRGLCFDYVFLGGVNEGVFPRPPGINAIYSDDDIDDLAATGIPMESRRVRSDRETALFHQTLHAANKRLHITWRTISREGREAKPSPLLTELLRLFPEGAVEQAASRSFVPEPAHVASKRDLRNTVMLRDSDDSSLDALASMLHDAQHGAAIEARRYASAPFDPFDGLLDDDDIKEQLTTRFNEDHVYSVDQIETYIACPFRFFARRVLGIEAIEEAEETFSALERGDIVHSVLERFHRQFVDMPITDIAPDNAEREMSRILDEVLDQHTKGKTRALQAVFRAEKGRMRRMLSRYLRIERERKDAALWHPAWFEVAFGRAGSKAAAPPGKPKPFVLETVAGKIRFSGRIDRIDINAGRCAIIDYKTGKGSVPTQSAIKQGEAIQLPVYILAVNHHLDIQEICTMARFLLVGGNASAAYISEDMPKDGWRASLNSATERIAACVRAIREGRFTPTPAKDTVCSYCPFQHACRHEKARIERKLGEDSEGQDKSGEEDA